MLNPFFLQGSKTEQNLVQDLINEQLRMYGVEVYYLPRKYVTKNTIIKEVIESKFDTSYPIEAYVENYEGYSNNPIILSKFGIQALNELTVTISRERFETYITPLINNLPDIELSTRPKEGDLIYFPLGDRLFEIKFVEHEKPFYQLQKTYIYTLSCELFRYEDEIIDTSISEIDDSVKVESNIETLTLVGSGVTATAITSIVNGAVSSIVVTNRGEKYTSPPRVAISSSPLPGGTAVGIATLISGLVDCDGTTSSKVQGVQIINPGFGYTTNPSVVFIGGGGSGATANAFISNQSVGIITITNGGSGYTTTPLVTFTSPGIGTTARALAIVSSAGTISAISITNAGSGYTQLPAITIGSPFGGGSGSFIESEVIVGSVSSTTAVVRSWNINTFTLTVSNKDGDFVIGETIQGQQSGASYQLKSKNTDNLVNSYPQNNQIELEADNIIDFSELNPFGNP